MTMCNSDFFVEKYSIDFSVIYCMHYSRFAYHFQIILLWTGSSILSVAQHPLISVFNEYNCALWHTMTTIYFILRCRLGKAPDIIRTGRLGFSLYSLFKTLSSAVEGQLGIVRVCVTHINVTINLSRPLIDNLTRIKCAMHSLIESRIWYYIKNNMILYIKTIIRQLVILGILAI